MLASSSATIASIYDARSVNPYPVGRGHTRVGLAFPRIEQMTPIIPLPSQPLHQGFEHRQSSFERGLYRPVRMLM